MTQRTLTVPMLDLRAQYRELQVPLQSAIARVCDAQEFILGGEVEAFEAELARSVGGRFAIGVSSGSDALLCALLALGIGPGDEVLTTPFTFIATAEAIVRVGARPRFVDVEPRSLNLDVERIASELTPCTRAIVPVHLFGAPADLRTIASLAKERELSVLEDAAQALGASLDGRKLGTWGNLGCYSFFPSKPLGAFGDGGLIVTDDAELAARCRELRSHGTRDKVHYRVFGGNFRLDALQAAILRVKLPYLSGWIERRARHAQAYDAAFGDHDGLQLLGAMPGAKPAFAQYTLRVPEGRRDALAEHLKARGVQTAVYYPLPLHLQPCFAGHGLGAGQFPESERAAREVLSLPLFPELTLEQRDHVIASVLEFFG